MQSSNATLRGKQWLSKAFALILCASLLLSSIAAAPAPRLSQTDTPPTPEQPAPAAAPALTAAGAQDPARVNFHQIVVKFKDGVEVTAQAGQLASASTDLEPVVQALSGQDVRPLFSTGAELESELKASAAANPASVPALSRYYLAQLQPEATFEQAQAILQSLQENPAVETAYMEPVYTAASSLLLTADLSASQTYLDANPGMNVRAAWSADPGSRGLGVQIVDIEDGWQIGHEDLPIRNSDLIESSNSSDTEWVNHGTAVIGVMAAKNNGFGVTGIASDSAIRLVSRLTNVTANAIAKAAANSRPGDIIVLPIQALGPVSNTACPTGCDCSRFESIPVEYWQANYDAILAATQKGVIVVEAAGNGAMNLDSSRYGGAFDRDTRDSGAILVGAGTADTNHAPVCDANYGKRIDVQGWGENVTTTGYGDAPESGADPIQFYTNEFGESSAATAMVAGAAASLQGVALKRGYKVTPDMMRSILRSTGTAQVTNTDMPIGPLPNVKNAIDKKLSAGVTLLKPDDSSVVSTLRPLFIWQSFLNATNYQLQVSDDSAFRTTAIDKTFFQTEYLAESNLTRTTQYFWRVRAYVNDAWQDWASSQVFRFTTTNPGSFSAPGMVTLLKPDSSSSFGNDNNFQPTFTWKALSPAPEGYQIQISTSYYFTGAADIFVDAPTYQPAPLAPNSRFYWRVRAFNGDPATNALYGPWTGRRVLYTGLDISGIGPLGLAADGREDTLRPTFDWSDIANARSYQVQVSQVNSFKTWILSETVSMPTNGSDLPSQYTPSKPLPSSKTLYWRVRARGVYVWSSWSAPATLMTLNPPSTPALLGPKDGGVVRDPDMGVLFTWSRPGRNPDTYQIQIAADKKFETIIEDQDGIPNPDPADTIKVPNYTSSSLSPDNLYYWRVRAIGDGVSEWSVVRIVKTAPPAPTGLSVDDLSTLQPVFNWIKVDTARSYRIQVAYDNAAVTDKSKLFTPTTRITASASTVSAPPYRLAGQTLPRKATLIWRVQAVGLYGDSNWTYSDDSFTTPKPPNTPAILSPANGSAISTFSPVLDWAPSELIKGIPSSNPVSYEIQISNRTDFKVPDPNPDNDFVVDETDLTVTYYAVPTDLFEKAGSYYWRVRAVNADGEFSFWSPRYSFITPGMISGTITDALTDDPLANATVQLNELGVQVTTDNEGKYNMRGVPSGNFMVQVAASGYMRQQVPVGFGPGANRTRNLSLAPIPDNSTLRIVVTWNGAPADLDAHLWLPASDKYHVYNKDGHLGSLSDVPYAALEQDDNDGFGPEIISIAKQPQDRLFGNGAYRFAVRCNNLATDLATSGARVQVYDGSKRIADVSVPTSGTGHWWNVFTLDSATRKISVNSYLTDNNPAPYGD